MYKLSDFGPSVILLADDGTPKLYIPIEPANSDYQAYLAWLAEGNEPLPAPDPIIGDITDLAEAKKVAGDYVRTTAYGKLQPTDWVVVREMEAGVAAPADITAFRTATRAAAEEKVSTIEGKQKLSTLKDYLHSDEFASWPEPPSA